MKDLGYAQLLLEIPDRVDERNSTSLVAMAEKAMQRQVEHVTSMLHRAKSLDITRALEKRDANDRRPNLTLHHRLNRLYKRIFRGFQNIRTHVGGIEDIACPGVIQGAYGADPDLFKPSTELYARVSSRSCHLFNARCMSVSTKRTNAICDDIKVCVVSSESSMAITRARGTPYTISKSSCTRSPINSVDTTSGRT